MLSSPHTTLKRMSAALLASTLAVTAMACNEEAVESTPTGTMQMALTALSTDGDTYRLRKATLNIDGPTASTVVLDEAYGEDPLFRARVETGAYTIELEDGWALQRWTGEAFEVVDAELLTMNPAKVMVERNATTIVSLVFETIDDEIEFATGDLEVRLEVNHLDCAHGETIVRSCGQNLTGRQFRMCDSGWWDEWSECAARCDRGYCLFKDPATFEAASVALQVEAIGFESYATGSVVPTDRIETTHGEAFSDLVTFVSVGASNQNYPFNSETPFIHTSNEDVVLFGGGDEGDASIQSSAGPHNTSGVDAIEAQFPTDAPLRGVAMGVDYNEAGYSVALYNAAGSVVARIAISSGDGTHFGIIADPTYDHRQEATTVRITPSAGQDTPHGTFGWSLTEFAYAF